MMIEIVFSVQFRRRFLVVVVGFMVFVASVLRAQVVAPAGATSTQATSAASDVVKVIPFEVVSIRPTLPGRHHGDFFTDDGFTVIGTTPHTLLTYVSKKLIGVPDWCLNERYDVTARVAEADLTVWKNMSFKQKSLAMRPMLEARFGLKWHTETRMQPGYGLVIAKNGVKLKDATPGEAYPNGLKGKDGSPQYGVFMAFGKESGLIGQAASMEQITYYLQMFANAPVVDKTGLTGTYDFRLRAVPESNPSVSAPRVASEPTSDVPTLALAMPYNDGPSLLPAVQQQLGLKLVAGKVPVEYVVVDHIERPTAN